MRQALSASPLAKVYVDWLSERGIRKGDTEECWVNGHSPADALLEALLQDGPSYVVFGTVNGAPTPVGAFGLSLPDTPSEPAAIWSLWTDDLDGPMKRCILRNTRQWVIRLLEEARVGVACNYVLDSNKLAVSWLRASGCFAIAEETDRVGQARKSMRYFQTKPLSVLRGATRHV